MLIKQKPEKGTIVAVKLISGDEIVGKIERLNATELVVSRPIAIGLSPQGVGFAPFMLSAAEDATLTFKLEQVITYVQAREEIKNAYIQSTSGITPAGAGSLPEGLVGA